MESAAPDRLPELHERELETGRIESALAGARDGTGDLLLIEGPPGIGKTSLLDLATSLADDHGVVALRARASEVERDLAFGVFRQALEPVVGRADAKRRRRLFAGSAAHAAPVLGIGDTPPPLESNGAILHGLLWLIANLAEENPLLIAIDDAQWADPASARLFTFLATRMVDLPCLIVVSSRSGPGAIDLAATASDPAARAIHPGPLSAAACEAVVRSHFSPEEPESEFVDACRRVTAGNPYYLHALAAELRRAAVRPVADAVALVDSASPRTVAKATVARLSALGADPTAIAQALAVLGGEATIATIARLAETATIEAIAAVERLELADLVVGTDPVCFAHSIIRNSVYSELGRARRIELHRRAAALLREQGALAEQVASHLASVPPGGDVEALGALRVAAVEAIEHGSPESAVTYLRRALIEPPPQDKLASVLLQLGIAETATDLGAAVMHLEKALELATDPDRRLLISAVLSRALFFGDRLSDAARVAGSARGELGEGREEIGRQLAAIELASAMMEPSAREVADALGESLNRQGIDQSDLGAKALESALAYMGARAGGGADAAVARAERALEGGVLLAEDNGRAAFLAAVTVLALADDDRATDLLEAGRAAAAERGDLAAVAGNRVFSCLALLVSGRLADAEAAGQEGLDLSEAQGVGSGLAWGTGFLAAVQIERGEIDAAGATLERAGEPTSVPDNAHWHAFLDARSRLKALRGDLPGALAEVRDLGLRFERVGGKNPAFVPWRSRAAELIVALKGDRDEAVSLALEEVEQAHRWGAPRALGVALRAAGHVIGEDEGLELLRRSVEILEGSPARLELARSQTMLGAALRRAKARSDARDPLTRGMENARRCGARPLAERAYEELRAAGAHPRKVLAIGLDSLTPSELRVARLAAEGATNREIAQELFVTLKTVEFHLRQTYRKLDIASRRALPDALDDASFGDGTAGPPV